MTQPALMPFKTALTTIRSTYMGLKGVKAYATSECLHKVLAQDIVSDIFIPPHDNSAMDGYALSFSDWASDELFTVSQRIPAGHSPSPLKSSTCARIFTGAPIPPNADTVIMQENAELDSEGRVKFLGHCVMGDNVRPKGQDVHQGQTVLTKGTRLTPQHIGLLTSLGLTQVNCFEPLKIGILTTGDELVFAGDTLKPGQIYNSNGPMIHALIQKMGLQSLPFKHVRDDPKEIRQALETLSHSCDLIITCGGVSVGEEDHIKTVITQNGQLNLWKIAIKPGKPIALGDVFNTPIIGLPGNPSSCLITFHWFTNLIIRLLSGEDPKHPQAFKVYPDFVRNNHIRRDEFIRVTLNDRMQAIAHQQQSSGALLASCVTDGYLHIPAGQLIERNTAYDFYPFQSF